MNTDSGFSFKQKQELVEIVGTVVDQKLLPVKKDIKTIIGFFDRQIINHEKRITRVESHLGI